MNEQHCLLFYWSPCWWFSLHSWQALRQKTPQLTLGRLLSYVNREGVLRTSPKDEQILWPQSFIFLVCVCFELLLTAIRYGDALLRKRVLFLSGCCRRPPSSLCPCPDPPFSQSSPVSGDCNQKPQSEATHTLPRRYPFLSQFCLQPNLQPSQEPICNWGYFPLFRLL